MDAWWEPLIRAHLRPGARRRRPHPDRASTTRRARAAAPTRTASTARLDRPLDGARRPASRARPRGSTAAARRRRRATLGRVRAASCSPRSWPPATRCAARQGDDPAAWTLGRRAPSGSCSCPGAALIMHWVNRPTTQQIAMFGANTPACERPSAFRRAGARPSGRGLRVLLRPGDDGPVTVDVRRQSAGRRIGRARRVKRFAGRHGSFRWRPRRLGARLLRGRLPHPRAGRLDRRPPRGRSPRPRAVPAGAGARAAAPCALVQSFALGRPGLRRRAAAAGAADLGAARGEPQRGRGCAPRRARREALPAADARGRRTHRLRLSARGLARGKYRVTLLVAGNALAHAHRPPPLAGCRRLTSVMTTI